MLRWTAILFVLALAGATLASDAAADDLPLPPPANDWQTLPPPMIGDELLLPNDCGFTQFSPDSQPFQQPTAMATPEPATLVFLSIGGAILAVGATRRRRTRSRV